MLKTLCGPLGPGPMAVGFDGISPCFLALVLDSIPVAILLVHIWPQCRSIYRRRPALLLMDSSSSYWIQILSCFFMTIFPIVMLLVHLIKVDPSDEFTYIYPYELIAQVTQFAAWLCGTSIILLASAYDVPLNYGIRLWWLTNFLISCKDVQSQAVRMAQGMDITSLLVISCVRLFVSGILAADSAVSLVRVLRRTLRTRSERAQFSIVHDLHHPWLQTQKDATTRYDPTSNSQIWNTWLSSGIQSNAADNGLNVKGRNINALNVLSWFEGVDTDGNAYVRFSVEVDPVDPSEKAWVFSSSFSDWIWLGHAVKKACESENIPCNLPEFPSSVKGGSSEVASILQLYFQHALKCSGIQTPLATFLQGQTKLQFVERDSSRFAQSEANTVNLMEILPAAQSSSSPIESRSFTVKQKFNEVITSPIAAMLERKLRLPSDEVVQFQTKDDHDKIVNANIVRYSNETHPTQFEVYVSTATSSWSVRRRFNEFLELHSKLHQLFDNRLLPVLLSKPLLLSSHHPGFLDNRCRQLDIFIQSLVKTDYFECRPLYDFLCHDKIECSEISDPAGSGKAGQVHKFGIVISKWEFSDNIDNQFNPVYYFEVYEYFSSNQFLKWTISCALPDFKNLHTSLKRRFPHDAVPDLPKWSSMRTTADSAFGDTLASQLELFLQKLINCSPFSCPEINAFLELDNGNRHISTGMHNVALQ